MTLLISYILLALVVSFLCSLLEATLLTLSPVTIETAKARGKKWAGRMERLKADVDRPLSAILTLNTVAHTMGAAGAGAEYARLYGNATEAVFAGVLTLAILVVTEIIPKTLGARYATQLAGPVSWMLPWLILMLAPLVWLCRQTTRLLTLGKAAPPRHREELLAVARIGLAAGDLDRTESDTVRNLLGLDQTLVRDIMTPKAVMFALPQETRLAAFADLVAGRPFSRIPVYGKTTDDVTGFVLRTDALLRQLQAPYPQATLEEVLRPIGVVLDHLEVDRLFQRFITEHHHIMLVRDEFGSVVGLVTLEDVVETIFGFEIVDERDEIVDLQAYARKLWRKRAARMGVKTDEDGVVVVE
ncbi:MAG: CNNM domain-containing protein [Verrucomicrobia bacterium]|nr:CNNM domain-containing protein [Verrucomicrobiota bacterium]MDA1006912.1 CNNM domain-containing protein [Verrucomicrobiota bacterium]